MADEKKNIEPDIDLEDDEPEEDSTLPALDEPGEAVPEGAGEDVIARYARHAPAAPGVYRMSDARGEVLYVGKAKNIKKRIIAYRRPQAHPTRIARMIAATAAIEFVSTATETEALLLEANLIKRLRPRFNVLLRDDKSFPYILISGDHTAPQILKHRGARNRRGDYFGPFASVWAVNRTITALERAFLIRSCSNAVYESRTRPCLLHQIKRCSAPCTGEISHLDYAELVREAKAFLSGRSRAVKEELAAEMEKASTALDFERAAIYRDRLAALSAIQAHQGINPRGVEEADVFALHQEGGFSCVEVFFFRTGQNWGNRAYFPRADRSLGPEDVLGAFIAQFYDDKPSPRCIFVSHDVTDRALIGEALSVKSGRRVEVLVPQRGEKKDLVEHALANAREALGRKLADTSSQQRLLGALAQTFGLARPPNRVEIYDNSHIQGTNAVGAMIVAGPDGLVKNAYRKFTIRGLATAETAPHPSPLPAGGEREGEGQRASELQNLTDGGIAGGDDYAMMREVLQRRFARALKEDPERDRGSWPDLVLIDGGQGQLNIAQSVLAELGVDDVAIAAIAKGPDRNAGRERFFFPGRAPFALDPRDPVLYFLQRLRDEAHRFAIGTHRAKRTKALGRSPLDEIAGIGARRKQALLHHFGSARAVARAGLGELERATGISKTVAKKIYDHFHADG
jgi:excinuclease ABC subunit C